MIGIESRIDRLRTLVEFEGRAAAPEKT